VAKPFRFRLEPVLDLRTRREELLQMELAQSLRAFASQQERAVAAQEALEAGVAAMRDRAAGSASLLDLRSGHEEIGRLRRVMEYEREVAAQMEAIALERREDLVRASQERETLVSLRDRAKRAHVAEAERKEQGEMDELATRRAARQAGAGRGAAA
jgi:flagellar FliJ protein